MRKILLAEHHDPTREHLQGELTRAGYRVFAARSLDEALTIQLRERPPLAVVAVDFPAGSGAHLTARLRAVETDRKVTLLVVGKGHLGHGGGVEGMLGIEFDAFVMDPVRANALIGQLEALDHPDGRSGPGESRVFGRPAVLAGSLTQLPLPNLIHSLFRLGRDGALVVTAPSRVKRTVYVHRGCPVAFDSTDVEDGFVAWLKAQGVLTDSQANAARAGSIAGQRPLPALERVGFALEGEELGQQLRAFTREKVASVVGMAEGTYEFFAGAEFTSSLPPVEISPLAPILIGARAAYPSRVFVEVLSPHRAKFPSCGKQFRADLPRLGLDTGDLKFIVQLSGRVTLDELLGAGKTDLRAAYSLLWFLWIVDLLRFSKTPATATGEALPREYLTPSARRPLPPEMAYELRDSAVKVLTGSPLRALGVSVTASAETIEQAYLTRSAQLHPDQYAGYDLSELDDLLSSVQERLLAARNLLKPDESRRRYLEHVFSKLKERRRAPIDVDAELALRLGVEALDRGDHPAAVAAFEDAVARRPEEPELLCHLALALLRVARRTPQALARAKGLIETALRAQPRLEAALVIGALADFAAGDPNAARQRLRKVLEMNPESKLARRALARPQ